MPAGRAEKIRLQIDGLTHAGDGVGRYRGMAVFVPGTMPGDTVLAEVAEVKKSFARARLLEIIGRSPGRRDPRCSHYTACGGCRLQHVNYEDQLRLKTGLVRDSLARIAGLGSVPVLNCIGMANPWHYRNKVRFQVKEEPGGIRLGLYEEKSRILTAVFKDEDGSYTGCLLVDRELNETASDIEKLLNRHGAAVDRHGREGRFFRHVVLRKGFFTGEIMVVLATGNNHWPREKEFVSDLLTLRPRIKSLVRNINGRPYGPVPGLENRILAGREYITDRLGHLTFMISPLSFYQVNPAQTLVLYRKALEYAELDPDRRQTVVDAYSGVGTIALFMAGRAEKVYGLEAAAGAVEDARRNAALNGINNTEFLRGDVEKTFPDLAARGLLPGVVVLDPPRSGCRREVLEAVADMQTPRVVYVSCDPGTLARDLGLLAGMGYRVEEVQPVDMFPWTSHIEVVARIEKVRSNKTSSID